MFIYTNIAAKASPDYANKLVQNYNNIMVNFSVFFFLLSKSVNVVFYFKHFGVC